jgi:hypothetical protein
MQGSELRMHLLLLLLACRWPLGPLLLLLLLGWVRARQRAVEVGGSSERSWVALAPPLAAAAAVVLAAAVSCLPQLLLLLLLLPATGRTLVQRQLGRRFVEGCHHLGL